MIDALDDIIFFAQKIKMIYIKKFDWKLNEYKIIAFSDSVIIAFSRLSIYSIVKICKILFNELIKNK